MDSLLWIFFSFFFFFFFFGYVYIMLLIDRSIDQFNDLVLLSGYTRYIFYLI